MQVMLLVNGKDALEKAQNAARLAGISCKQGKYGEEGLYVVTFEIEGDTVASARRLAELRDSVLCDAVKILRDDPSDFFCRRLYPKIMRFERNLRMAITIAICANEGNFNDKLASSLEWQTLGGLDQTLFYDKQLRNKLKDLMGSGDKKGNNGNAVINKSRVLEMVQTHDEATTWSWLFGNDLPFVKCHFLEIRDLRNDVMHFHTIDYAKYRLALKTLSTANSELGSYIENSLDDVQYPTRKAADAKEAMSTLAETYSSIAEALATSMHTVETVQKAFFATVDTSWLTTLQENLAKYSGISNQMADVSRQALKQYTSLIADQQTMADSLRPVADALDSIAKNNPTDHSDGLDNETRDNEDENQDIDDGEEGPQED